VEVEYRSASDAGRQPDVQIITKQMAIVAWQPGPNRIVQVPTEVRRPARRRSPATGSDANALCRQPPLPPLPAPAPR
jgi:hypothetical protein